MLVPRDVVEDGQVVDAVHLKYFGQLEGNQHQGVGVVALPGVQHAGDAADVAQGQLVVAVLGAAGGEDDGILGQRPGKLRVVVAALLAAIAAGHHHKLADGAGFDGLHHLVGQLKDLGVGKAAYDGALLDLRGWRAGLGHADDGGEVLLLADTAGDVRAARPAGHAGGEQALHVAVPGGHDAVGGHQNGAVKAVELVLLLPPGIAVVAGKVWVLLEEGVVLGGQHLRVGVDVDAGIAALL